MAENKTSFVLYSDSKSIIDLLSNEEAGLLLKTLFAYVNDENPVIDKSILIVFEMIKLQLKRDLKKWETKKEGRSKAGKASAEAKRIARLNQQNQTNSTNVDFVEQTSTTSTDSVSVSVSDSVSVNDILLKKETKSKNEVFGFESLKKESWVDVVTMQNNISKDDLPNWIEKFNIKLATEMDIKKYQSDYVQHFVRWLPQEIAKLKKEEIKVVQMQNHDAWQEKASRPTNMI